MKCISTSHGDFVMFVVLVVGAAVLVGNPGCAPAALDAEEDVARSQNSLMSNVSSWAQGQASPVSLGSASDRFCFLIGVSGKFEGAGESVFVRINGSQWEVFGSSSQSGVAALARCQLGVAPAERTAETSLWSQGQSEIDLGPVSNRTCFLTHIQGKFRGAGEAVWVRQVGANFKLGGQSLQTGVGAKARCVLRTDASAFADGWNWTQGSPPTPMVQAFTENNGYACGLTRMTGKFQGSGESIVVNWDTTQRILFGSSYQTGVGASANCF